MGGSIVMGVPQNDPKWLVFVREYPIKMDDLGVHPDFRKPPYDYFCYHLLSGAATFWQFDRLRNFEMVQCSKIYPDSFKLS